MESEETMVDVTNGRETPQEARRRVAWEENPVDADVNNGIDSLRVGRMQKQGTWLFLEPVPAGDKCRSRYIQVRPCTPAHAASLEALFESGKVRVEEGGPPGCDLVCWAPVSEDRRTA